MSDNETWIEEQEAEAASALGAIGGGRDCDRLLEIGRTNRDISADQGQLLNIARSMDRALKVNLYEPLARDVEDAQAQIDNQARKDFMKVAIEQYQGKLAHFRKSKELEAAL